MTHNKNTPRSIRYTWDEGSHISRLDAQMDSDGFYVVQIFPGKSEKEGALAGVPAALHRYGFPDAYPDVKEDKSVLVLANVKSLDKLVGAISRGEYVSGTPTIEAINGHVEKISAEERRKNEKFDTVKWHGRVGLVGHASILATGFLQRPFDIGRIINAPLGAINPFLMSWLGSGKDHVDVPSLMRDMRSFFAQEGINLPYMSGEDQHMGFVQTAKHFLAAHPIEVGSSLGIAGSGGMIASGIKGIKTGGSGWSRVWLGLINITRDGIAIFVPEKKTKQQEELQGNWVDSIVSFPGKAGHLVTHPGEIPAATWDFVKEAPLRMVGFLSLVSDALYAKDAMDAFKKNHEFRQDAYENGGPYEYKTWRGKTKTVVIEKEKSRQGIWETLQDKTKIVTDYNNELHDITTEVLKKAKKTGAKPVYPERYNELHSLLSKAIEERSEINQTFKAMTDNQLMSHSWQGKITPYLGLVTAAAFLGAGVLMSISSKHHKGNDLGAEALFSRLCSVNAKILSAMPEEQREPMLHRLTDYMRVRKDITGDGFNADRFETEVQARINQMQHSPWIERVNAPTGFPSQAAGVAIA